jgi:hypothetical protein
MTRKKVGVRSLTNNSLVWNFSKPISFCLEEKVRELQLEKIGDPSQDAALSTYMRE